MPVDAGILPALAAALGTPALPLRFRLASVRCGRRRLGSRAIGRLWRFVARAPTIRQDRSPSQAPVATPAALPRYHLHRLLPPLPPVACTPLPHLRADRSRSFEMGQSQPGCALRVSETLKRRWASDARSRLHRSRIRSEQSHTQRAA